MTLSSEDDGDAVNARLPVAGPAGVLSDWLAEDVEARARAIVDRGTPENTKRAYRSDLRYVAAWCEASGIDPGLPLPTSAVVRFVVDHFDGLPQAVDEDLVRGGFKADLGPHAVSTITRRLSALSGAHKVAGLPSPCEDPRVGKLLSRARVAAALAGWAPARKAALPLEALETLLAACGDDLRGVRDRAMILFGFASGGRRRSEVSSATVSRLTRLGDEFTYDLGVTKNSQDGDGGTVPVAGRAAAALEAWLSAGDVSDGFIFRAVDPHGLVGPDGLSDRAVNRVVKKLAKRAGLDPARYGAHSLRSGFMTESGLQNVPLAEAMAMSRHRTVAVAIGYHQSGYALNNKGARIVG